MAGMLPGVELARRRKAHHHGYYDSTAPSSPRPPYSAPSSMDEAAVRARCRLQQKLRNFTSRLDINYHQKNKESISEGHNETNTVQKKEKLFNLPKLRRSNLEKQVCSICLEKFKGRQSVMNLPCCHRYHADCLLPWLASNSHCPYCRTHVQT